MDDWDSIFGIDAGYYDGGDPFANYAGGGPGSISDYIDTSGLTPAQLAQAQNLFTMTDAEFDDFTTTNDDTQSGGFWSDLGNLFSNTAANLGSNLINRAGAAGNNAINTALPATTTTQQTAAQQTQQMQTLLIASALGLAAWLYFRRQ